MRYLTVAAEYIGSCIKDDSQGQIDCHELLLDEDLCKELEEWNADYKVIIPLDMDEREQRYDEIKILDERGIRLAKKLTEAIKGGAKVKYYSEGKLKYLELDASL